LNPHRAIPLRLLALALLASLPVTAQSAPASVIRVALVGEPDSIAPGQPFWVGVHFQMEEGWHIYWINPGDSGEPPRVEWRLPAGFQAGEFEWPHPERLVTRYSTDYGYAGQMLLLARMRPPVSLAPGGKAELGATVKWVVCREVCIPGKTEVALSLPVQGGAAPPSNPLFAEARQRIPQPAPAHWRARAQAEKDEFVLSLETGQPIAKAEFFPLQEQQIENAAPQTAHSLPRGVRLRLRKSEQLLKPISNLKGVIVFPSGRSYGIDVPVIRARN
jgi:thiol:disulfide interchange protein DsbD